MASPTRERAPGRSAARTLGLARRRAAAAGMQVESVREDTRPGPAVPQGGAGSLPGGGKQPAAGAWPRRGNLAGTATSGGRQRTHAGWSRCSALVRRDSDPWRPAEDSSLGGVAVVGPGEQRTLEGVQLLPEALRTATLEVTRDQSMVRAAVEVLPRAGASWAAVHPP